MVSTNGDHAPDVVDTNGAGESPDPPDGHGEGQRHPQHASSSESVEVEMGDMGSTAVEGVEAFEETAADAHALVMMRRELDRVRGAASGLESALRESRSEVLQLRELLATEENTTREQAGRISSLRYLPRS